MNSIRKIKTGSQFLRFVTLILLIFFYISTVVFSEDAIPQKTSNWFVPQVIESPEVKEIDHEGNGTLYQVGDLRLCVLKGSYYDMGVQQGRMLAQNIVHVFKTGYIKKAVWDRDYTPEYVYAQSSRMVKHIPERFIEEARGIIDGLKKAGITDISLDELLIGTTVAEILHFPANTPPETGKGFSPDSSDVHAVDKPDLSAVPQCTNFTFWGKWTEDGRILHARNLDWSTKRDVQDDAVIFVYHPEGIKPYMLMGWAGGIGSLTGINAHGISVGQATLPSINSTFDGRPCFVTVRMMLEQDTLEKAVDIVVKGPESTGWIYTIADANTCSARTIESDPVIKNVYEANDPKENEETKHYALPDMIRRTNHPASKEGLVALARRVGPLLKPPLKVESWDQFRLVLVLFTNHNTYQRYDWLGKQFQTQEGKGPITVQTALEWLANGPVLNPETLHSCVFDPKNLIVYASIAGNNPPVTASHRTYTKIDMKQWF
ncbi:MAG TPA: C45 family autoproteolytic acyltransferase/hydrolase [Candidatus Hydrogenedens sp.]|nr:C45 family autoproteolytic acyltransferase/hydrolase [Candidatus Hydrogenedens sp.]